MLSWSVRQILHALEQRATGLPQASSLPRFYQQARTIRTKHGTDFYTNALRQDERLLKKLEAQLERAKTRLKREEELDKELARMQASYGKQDPFGNHNHYFWHQVLSEDDRAKLLSFRIRNFDEMYSAYAEAIAATKRPPQTAIDDLEPRLRLAHEMYLSIPHKIARQRSARLGYTSIF